METKVVSFEQLPELIQNLVERIESLEKTVREKHQPLPLEGELMSVEDLCKLLGKSKSAVYRTVRYRDIPYIRQGNRLYFDRATIKKMAREETKYRVHHQYGGVRTTNGTRSMVIPKWSLVMCD